MFSAVAFHDHSALGVKAQPSISASVSCFATDWGEAVWNVLGVRGHVQVFEDWAQTTLTELAVACAGSEDL